MAGIQNTNALLLSFANAETALIWSGQSSRKLPADFQDRALAKLRLLHRARSIDDLRNPPGNRLHALKDERIGQHSISINKQWPICFVWKDGHAHNVEIVDYH